ncbi:rhodanese-like domain-containing protein [Deinococcus lacus]|uniref:Rhodanese-like domain-containing protein n=1 Tax=Deinococcus lacus TaxID=392561 RepID=A0ABW1YA86_9DEIO
MDTPVSFPQGLGTVIDLRPQELRFADPLERLISARVQPVSLAAIEAGEHGLTPELGHLTVICERGLRSGLAAQYLRADGLDAAAYPGGVPALRRALAGDD